MVKLDGQPMQLYKMTLGNEMLPLQLIGCKMDYVKPQADSRKEVRAVPQCRDSSEQFPRIFFLLYLGVEKMAISVKMRARY